ncbi:MAG: kinase [Chloroflexi bacterium]|nr:kinase [Chloroflexota bacterium]
MPATCGELLQGVDGRGPVLVSLPLERDGTVEVALVEEPGERVRPDRPRARAALCLALDACGWRGGARVRLGAEVPPGRGLGSSTVDVAGVLCAAAAAAGIGLDPARLMRLATAVEPSDTSPLAGLWAADHVHGGRLRHLGPAPAAWVAAIDGGGMVDTLALHARAGPGPALPTGTLDALAAAVAAGDLAAIGALATASARRNQQRLPHPAFPDALAVAAAIGAAGVCAAHSGTLLGLLCGSAEDAWRAATELRDRGWPASVDRVSAPGATVRGAETRAKPSAGRESGRGGVASPPVETRVDPLERVQSRNASEAERRPGVRPWRG